MPPTRIRHRRLGWAAVLALWPSLSAAQVLEIAPSGEVTTYARPTVFSTMGAAPIASTQPGQRPPVTSGDVAQTIRAAAQWQKIDADLVAAVAWRESRGRQAAISSRGAVGVMQLTTGTARDLGVDRLDLQQNIYGGAAYLRRMLDRYRNDVTLALAAYNAGPGAVDHYGGVPPYRETQAYVAAILQRLPVIAAPQVTAK